MTRPFLSGLAGVAAGGMVVIWNLACNTAPVPPGMSPCVEAACTSEFVPLSQSQLFSHDENALNAIAPPEPTCE